MQVRLENTESQKSQIIGDLIRSYNRSKREEAESEPLNLMSKMKRAISWQV